MVQGLNNQKSVALILQVFTTHPNCWSFASMCKRCNHGVNLHVITKTCLYNSDALEPHFWGLQGYTLFFLFLLKNIDCGTR